MKKNIQIILIIFILSILIYLYIRLQKSKPIVYSYQTFDGAFKIISDKTYYPNTVNDVIEIIKNTKNKIIRCSGSMHTFNDISISSDIIIRTRKLNKVIKLDKINKQITVQCGMILLELNNYLEEHNLAIPILPAIPWQTIVGALSTSTHGSCANYSSMASLLVDATIITFDGTIKKITKNSTEFEALSPNLGCLGFIYTVTLQAEDLFAVDHRKVKMKINDFLNNYKKLQKDYEYLQAYLFPFSKDKHCSVYLRKKIHLEPNEYEDIRQQRKNNTANHKIDFGHNILTKTNEEINHYTEMEIGIPIEHIKNAVNKIINLYHIYKQKYNYSTKYSILVRFTKADKRSLLSMVANRDTVFIDIFNEAELHNNKYLNELFKTFHDYVIDKFKGRPHFGKKHYLTYEQMKHIYGSSINMFNIIRNKLDPCKMFSNNYVNRLLDK